ncbi:MAG: dihydroorotate dehydrogenase electron transfer subunit [Bacteroidales bacterium]|nr:dihydroorotate dehydrogenase electron transfer subunit [Bacteroidales bacterium]
MKQITDFRLVAKRDFGKSVLLQLHSEKTLPEIQPGQFVQVRVDGSPSTYLRRPISIHDVDFQQNEITLLVQQVGDGTRHLAAAEKGDVINIVLPLGNGFSIPERGEKCLLVGGGIGIAPLYYFAKVLNEKGIRPTLLLGGKTASDVLRLEDYRQLGETFVTTEDGSMGEKGFVTQHSLWQQQSFDKIYVCGPKPMMKAVAKLTAEKNTWCEVSLENLMACGLGACLCCVEDTVDGHVCVCKEGPVFNTRRLKW